MKAVASPGAAEPGVADALQLRRYGAVVGCDGGGFRAQDPRPERDRDAVRRRAHLRPLLVGEPAFGPGQDQRRARPEGLGHRFTTSFIGKVEDAAGLALAEQFPERQRVRNLRQSRASALLRGLDRDGLEPLDLHPLGDRAPGHHRQQPGNAKLGRFLHQPVGLRPLDRGEGEPHVGDRLRIARSAFGGKDHALAPRFRDARQPFARGAVEQQQRIARPHPQHVAKIIRLSRVELNPRALGQRLAHEQSRQAFRRPGRRRRHPRRLPRKPDVRYRWEADLGRQSALDSLLLEIIVPAGRQLCALSTSL